MSGHCRFRGRGEVGWRACFDVDERVLRERLVVLCEDDEAPSAEEGNWEGVAGTSVAPTARYVRDRMDSSSMGGRVELAAATGGWSKARDWTGDSTSGEDSE